MASAEHSELRIDRSIAPARTYRRGIWLWLAGLALLLVVGAGWFALQPRTISVQTTPVVTTYPSQQFAVIHSAGRVVAQRKAAISSKASGRLEWLGVAEGSHVRAGDVIARLNKGDLQAQVEAALANIEVARAALERAQVEELDATFSLKRTRDLIAGCECLNGCPTCVGPIGNTGPMAKTVALRILDLIGTTAGAMEQSA